MHDRPPITALIWRGLTLQKNCEGLVIRTHEFGDAGMQLIWTFAAVCLHSIELNHSRVRKVHLLRDVQLKAVIGHRYKTRRPSRFISMDW